MDCKLGTYDSGGLCLYCDHPCFSCETTATNCRSCNVGYYYSSAGVCSKCVNCPLCDSSGSCLSCYEGYYFSAGLCDLCSNLYSNCLLCESLGCNVCSFNYELTPSLTCALITAV